jgi:hypothetical protein
MLDTKTAPIALTRAERETFRRLTAGLTDDHRAALDAVLLVRPGGSSSSLSWFRQPPGAPSANAVLAHLARLRAVRALELPADLGRDVHQNRLLRLAREGAQTAVFQLQEYELLRRYAPLVAILLDTMATLTDETLDLHDRLIGTFFSKARSKYDREFAADGRAGGDAGAAGPWCSDAAGVWRGSDQAIDAAACGNSHRIVRCELTEPGFPSQHAQ